MTRPGVPGFLPCVWMPGGFQRRYPEVPTAQALLQLGQDEALQDPGLTGGLPLQGAQLTAVPSPLALTCPRPAL